MAALGNKNICRLDVAVNDSFAVGRVKRIGDVDTEIEEQLQIQGTSRDTVL